MKMTAGQVQPVRKCCLDCDFIISFAVQRVLNSELSFLFTFCAARLKAEWPVGVTLPSSLTDPGPYSSRNRKIDSFSKATLTI